MNSVESAPPKILVIGAGITGLAATHRILELAQSSQQDVDLRLIEASNHVGGAFGTKTRDGYIVELGADSFITNKPWGVDLVQRLGLEDRLISPDKTHQRSL